MASCAPGTAASTRSLIWSSDSMRLFARHHGRFPDSFVVRGFDIMLAKSWERILTRNTFVGMARLVWTKQRIAIDLALQSHKRMQERFRSRRTTGNMNIHRKEAINPLQHIVPLFERTAGDSASAHRNHVFRLRHLVVEPHHLRGHFLGHGAGHNHEIGLTRGGPENLGAEPGEIVTGHRGRNHLDGAAREAKLERPDRILAAGIVTPIQEFLHLDGENSLLAQFAAESFVHATSSLKYLSSRPRPTLRPPAIRTRAWQSKRRVAVAGRLPRRAAEKESPHRTPGI